LLQRSPWNVTWNPIRALKISMIRYSTIEDKTLDCSQWCRISPKANADCN
jgi:hypothetical protein